MPKRPINSGVFPGDKGLAPQIRKLNACQFLSNAYKALDEPLVDWEIVTVSTGGGTIEQEGLASMMIPILSKKGSILINALKYKCPWAIEEKKLHPGIDLFLREEVLL